MLGVFNGAAALIENGFLRRQTNIECRARGLGEVGGELVRAGIGKATTFVYDANNLYVATSTNPVSLKVPLSPGATTAPLVIPAPTSSPPLFPMLRAPRST